MKEKKMNLSVWMFMKVVPAIFFLMYYWMCTRSDFQPYYSYIQTAVFIAMGVIVAFQITYAKKKDIFDEFATENLKTTDSICLKVAYILMIITAITCIFPNVSSKVVGYCIFISILLLTLLRAIVFYAIDKKGM